MSIDISAKVVTGTFLEAEVTQIDGQGIWVLIGDKESFLPFEKFPWFREAFVGTIHHVELLNNNHLGWPDLDIDLAVESVEDPDGFPLVDKTNS